MYKHPNPIKKWLFFKKIWSYNYISNSFIKNGRKLYLNREISKCFLLLNLYYKNFFINKNNWISMLNNTTVPVFYYHIVNLSKKQRKKQKKIYQVYFLYCKVKWRLNFLKKLFLYFFKIPNTKLRFLLLHCTKYFFFNKNIINKIVQKVHKNALQLYY